MTSISPLPPGGRCKHSCSHAVLLDVLFHAAGLEPEGQVTHLEIMVIEDN